MSGKKRRINDENAPTTPSSNKTYTFIDCSTAKKPRLSARRTRPFTADDLVNYNRQRADEAERKDTEAKAYAELFEARIAEETATRAVQRIEEAWSVIQKLGFSSLYEFVHDLLTTRHPVRSAQVSNMLTHHGTEILDLIHDRHPRIANDWALSTIRQQIETEMAVLSKHFCSAQNTPVTTILHEFSLKKVIHDTATFAPTLLQVLRQAGNTTRQYASKKDPELIVATTICMLAKARHNHATEFQTTTCMYFLACGTSRSLFDVLNHAGITLSYTQAVSRLKQLGQERLMHMRTMVRNTACMLIWDNLNFAYRVNEQRHNNKDHFDNGTTATLMPLYDVPFGGLPLELKPIRNHRIPILKFDWRDVLPTREEAKAVAVSQEWHIIDILLDEYPELRTRFKDNITTIPCINQIPVHKSEQYPLPAMHIDESSLEGTLAVIDRILRTELKLTEEDIEKHGIFLCAGDQLTQLLLDKASSSRRDDNDLMDNVSRYTKGQDGLFHLKMAADRMVTNEYWGKPNSKSPWSLWKVNNILCRKPMVAGWKAKSLPPFRPSWELILTMTLPVHILDGFRIYCPSSTLEEWVSQLKSFSEIHDVARKVMKELCSARRVASLRRQPVEQRDIILENIILFNRDALYLRQFKYAIKRGDVGEVLHIATHWMVMFRGTGRMPKYADALFHFLTDLKSMEPQLRNAWLKNWLANLSGKADGFKEMDLLQEHQNFWAKIVYCARGSNRSWEWLAMVTISIFALRDVIRKVQSEYNTPYNGTSHTSPCSKTDHANYSKYMKDHTLQSYTPTRPNNKYAIPARELIGVGAQYANKPSAFRNFRYDRRTAENLDVKEAGISPSLDVDSEEEEDFADCDLGHNGSRSLLDEDLAFDKDNAFLFDDDEYPPGTDIADYISMTREIVDELQHFQ
ncbi:hypothetical protein H0H93_005717 [Arthromyces matolae]|nr:hypothetical protein H0H93_005717 [Arthromyces matolae]